MPKPVIANRGRRGFILITHTLMMAFTLAMVGLAVDAGTMYVIKGRLSSAVDAAALAAGRSVNLANDIPTAQTNAIATATQFFHANFPNNYLGTGTMSMSTPTFNDELDPNGNPTGILDIAVSASVPAPTYFIRILNVVPGLSAPNFVTVSATGTATRRGTVMILVLDTSTSMNAGSPTACSQMKTAAQTFITNFSPYDTIGVVQFGYTASLLYPPDKNFGSGVLNTELGAISCNFNTNTTSALWLAYEQIKSVNLPLAYNSIVLFTDGSPNGISANFPLRTQADTRYGQDYTQFRQPSGQPNASLPYPSAICTSQGATCAMPVICTGASTQTVTGTIPQGSGQTNTGTTSGLYLPISTDAAPSIPATCQPASTTLDNRSGNGPGWPTILAADPQVIRQYVAYIPDFDLYGNSTHGVPATSTPPSCPGATCTVANVTLQSNSASYYYETRDFWEFQVNNLCSSPSGTAVTPCNNARPTANQQWGGGVWSSYPTADPSQSNFFTTGPYTGYMRPDQPTTIVAATMNTAMSQAYWIRADASGCGGAGGNGTVCSTRFHPVINTIYLLGNAGDAADHEFLPVMANTQQIPALPYDNPGFVPYTNPAFQTNQEQGLYQVTADPTQLNTLFQKLASEVLRLSH